MPNPLTRTGDAAARRTHTPHLALARSPRSARRRRRSGRRAAPSPRASRGCRRDRSTRPRSGRSRHRRRRLAPRSTATPQRSRTASRSAVQGLGHERRVGATALRDVGLAAASATQRGRSDLRQRARGQPGVAGRRVGRHDHDRTPVRHPGEGDHGRAPRRAGPAPPGRACAARRRAGHLAEVGLHEPCGPHLLRAAAASSPTRAEQPLDPDRRELLLRLAQPRAQAGDPLGQLLGARLERLGQGGRPARAHGPGGGRPPDRPAPRHAERPSPPRTPRSRATRPIWLEWSTCVPPHSSRDQGPPISTTRTCSSYVSPNSAIAPQCLGLGQRHVLPR